MVSNLQRYKEVFSCRSSVFSFWTFDVAFGGRNASIDKKNVIFASLKGHNSMNMGLLKEKYQRFRQWQRRPSEFHIKSDKEHTCQCCGYQYVGNYCPRCSQKPDMGRINWHSIRSGVMDIWGLGTRSLPYSVWQLICRPGYFIGEYISGKRQVSFPPVKMLFVMAVIYSFVIYWLFPVLFNVQLEIPVDKEELEIMPFLGWEKKYFSWVGLMTALLFILPTWLLFQHAPRYPKHTIPEGFFIQVLMGVLVIVLNIVCTIIYGRKEVHMAFLLFAVLVIYYFIAYRQLFGYGVWGTIWRQVFMWSSVMCLALGALFLTNGIVLKKPEFNSMVQQGYQTGFATIMFILTGIILAIGYLLNRIAVRHQVKK